MRRTWTLVTIVLLVACAAAEKPPPTAAVKPAAARVCELPDRHRLFIREVLATWADIEAHILALDDAAPPGMYFPAKDCVFTAHVQGGEKVGEVYPTELEAVAIAARPWRDDVTLPNGNKLAPGIHAYSLVGDDGRPYFVLSLMDLWSEHPQVAALPDAADFIIGVGLHELVHTRQLPMAQPALERLAAGQPEVNENVLQKTMAGDEAYGKLHRESIDAFWSAVALEGEAKRAAVREGLAAVKARRKLLKGDKAWLARVEPIFLNLEGVGEWVRTRVLLTAEERRVDPAFLEVEPKFTGYRRVREMSDAEVLATVRQQTKREWAQEEGLALMLLLDDMVPSWRDRVFADPPGDLHALLAEVVE